MNRIEKTSDLHQNGGLNCAQSILTVFGQSMGLDPEKARLLGRPLCGINIGKHGVCGYVAGASIVLAMARDQIDEALSRKDTNQAIDEFCDQFKVKNGYLQCKHLVGADMSTPEGRKKIKEENLIAKHCYGYGRAAAAILEELL